LECPYRAHRATVWGAKGRQKACITGAPNDRRFFFFLLKPVILALSQREEAQQLAELALFRLAR